MPGELKITTDTNGLFSDGGIPLDERGEFVVKAQLRLVAREFEHPVLAYLQDEARDIYASLLTTCEERIAGVLDRAREMDKSLFMSIPRGDDLRKANGRPGRPKSSKGPPSAEDRKRQAEARTWGARGGKFYINSKGHKVYGTKPPEGDTTFREMSDKEVAQHVQKMINPTVFMGVDEKVVDAYVAAGVFTPDDAHTIQWFRKQFIDGDGGLIDQLKAEDPDFDESMQDAAMKINGMKLAQFMHEFFVENVVDAGNTQEEAEEAWSELAEKYEKGVNDARVQAALKQRAIEFEANINEVNLAIEGLRAATDNLHDDILDDPNSADSALKIMSVMQGLSMMFIAGKGQVAKRQSDDKFGTIHMKGTLQVNLEPLTNCTADFGEETKYAKAKVNLMRMNLAQLMAMYAGALMQDTRKQNGDFDPDAIAKGQSDEEKTIVADLIEKVINKKMNADHRVPKAEVDNVISSARAIAAEVAKMVGDFNKGQVPGLEKMFKDQNFSAEKLLDKSSEEGIGKVRKEILSSQQEREMLLKAQQDDSVEALPSAMEGGFWSYSQKQWDAITKKQAVDKGEPWKQSSPPRPFSWQGQAVNWIQKVKRGILAYDMGMGKTACVIASSCALMDQKKIKRSILILPPVLMEQWPKEIATYAPGIKPEEILDLSPYSLEERKMMLDSDAARNAKFIIMSSGTLCDPKDDTKDEANDGTGGMDNEFVDAMNKLDDTAVFVDEVHTGGYKTGSDDENRKSVRNRLLGRMLGNDTDNPREYAIGMTGTPMPNSAMDTFNITDLFAKGKVGNRDQWSGTLSSTTFDEDTGMRIPTNPDKVKELQQRLKPYVFSKLVSDDDVRPQLAQWLPPDPAQVRQDLKPSEKKGQNGYSQRDYFKRGGVIEKMANEKLAQILKNREKAGKEDLPEGMIQMIYKGLIVNMSRQAAISPALIDSTYGEDDPAPKIDRCVNDVVEHFNGGWGKKGEPIVIFGSTVRQFQLMKRRLMKAGIDPNLMGEISNNTATLDRAHIQDATNDGKIKIVFVGIKSGGAGLNLQKASNHMMFLDNPWTPADKKQALGRVQRVQQKKQVRVTTYSMPDTYDSVMEDKLAEKQVMSDMLTRDEDLDKLVRLTNENIAYITGRQKGSKAGGPRKMSSKMLEDLYETLVDNGEHDVGDMLTKKEWNDVEVNRAAQKKLPPALRAEYDQAKDRLDWRKKRADRQQGARLSGMQSLLNEYEKKYGKDKQKMPTETMKRVEKIERVIAKMKGIEQPSYKRTEKPPTKAEERAASKKTAAAREKVSRDEKTAKTKPVKVPKDQRGKATDDHDGLMAAAKSKKFDAATRYKVAKDALKSARTPKERAAAQKLVDKLKGSAPSKAPKKAEKPAKAGAAGALPKPKKAKHGYKVTSTKKIHGVPEYELALVHGMLRKTKAKDMASFLKKEIKPNWDAKTDGKYTEEKAAKVAKKWLNALKKDGHI